jgi:hypothetical protein
MKWLADGAQCVGVALQHSRKGGRVRRLLIFSSAMAATFAALMAAVFWMGSVQQRSAV